MKIFIKVQKLGFSVVSFLYLSLKLTLASVPQSSDVFLYPRHCPSLLTKTCVLIGPVRVRLKCTCVDVTA